MKLKLKWDLKYNIKYIARLHYNNSSADKFIVKLIEINEFFCFHFYNIIY